MNESSDMSRGFDLEAHALQAIDEYQKIRPLYEEFSKVITKILSDAFDSQQIKIHSIEARAKAMESFSKKASAPSPKDLDRPRYSDPLNDITDLAGVRVITFFPRTLDAVDRTIESQFVVLNKSDSTQILIEQEKFGYGSIHYVLRLQENRTALPEYSKFKDFVAEIQVRTILQHAWAEIEHDIQYKSANIMPVSIHRRFMSLASTLETADREFQAIQDEDERLRRQARQSVREGKLEKVEITPDALKTYLDEKLGLDGRMTDFSYQFTASLLHRLGFADFKQIDECISGYNDDLLSRILWSTRQGQISRFECQLLAGMGETYIRFHTWGAQQWFVDAREADLEEFRLAGIEVGFYVPPTKKNSRTSR